MFGGYGQRYGVGGSGNVGGVLELLIGYRKEACLLYSDPKVALPAEARRS